MTLIYDNINDCWVWVEKKNHNIELSPSFDEEIDAKNWLSRITNIVKGKD
mgnify:CR=1 FL=1